LSRLAAWCTQGAKMATAAEYREQIVSTDGRHVDGWRCPTCGRVVKIGESRSTNSDRGGWHSTLGPRWPRHYAWAAKRSKNKSERLSR
jgi:hypothetical protein